MNPITALPVLPLGILIGFILGAITRPVIEAFLLIAVGMTSLVRDALAERREEREADRRAEP